MADKNPDVTIKRILKGGLGNKVGANPYNTSDVMLIHDAEDDFFHKHKYYPSEFESPESRAFLTEHPEYIHGMGDSYDQAYEKGVMDEDFQKLVAKHYLGGAKDTFDATRLALEEVFGGPVSFDGYRKWNIGGM